LAAALTFIFANADALQVGTGDYSLWGGSAGARMAAYLGSYGAAAYGGNDLPKPVAVVMQYTGHSDYTNNDPPTYVCIGENDGIASPQAMERRVNHLNSLGIDTEFHVYPNLGHGFGLGIATSAEGWWKDALAFWEGHKHRKEMELKWNS
jgi:acetyl esterase/lipase